MDRPTARWLAGFFERAVSTIEEGPCVIIEAAGKPEHWAQVLPEIDEHQRGVSGYLLNFAYRSHRDSPLLALAQHDITPPPGTRVVSWEDEGFATLWLRPDVPLVPLALLVGDILTHITGAPDDTEYTVQIEYGF